MTRRPFLALVFCASFCASAATSAGAQAPPNATPRMLCADAMALVKREGSVLLSPGGASAERFVRDRSFCDLSEIADLRFAPTRDNPECPIGYRCREPDYTEWDWR